MQPPPMRLVFLLPAGGDEQGLDVRLRYGPVSIPEAQGWYREMGKLLDWPDSQ